MAAGRGQEIRVRGFAREKTGRRSIGGDGGGATQLRWQHLAAQSCAAAAAFDKLSRISFRSLSRH